MSVVDPNDPLSVIGDFDLAVWDNAAQARPAVSRRSPRPGSYRPGVRWNVGGNYTWSETTGNYEGEGRNTPSSGSPSAITSVPVPIEVAVPFGFLDEDITHRIQAWGNYRLDFDKAGALNLGGILRYQSGRIWSRTASVGTQRRPDLPQ